MAGTSRSWAIFSTAAWPARISICSLNLAHDSRSAGPAMWLPHELECLAPNIRRVPRIEEALDGADVIIVLRVQTERIHEPALAAEEYILGYQLTARTPAARSPRCARAASRTDDSRPGNRSGRGGWAPVRRARASNQRARRAHGASLPSRSAVLPPMRRIPQRNGRMLLIRNGRVLDPASQTDAILDILLDGERISTSAPILSRPARRFSTPKV